MENFESKKIEIKENKDREETIKNKINDIEEKIETIIFLSKEMITVKELAQFYGMESFEIEEILRNLKEKRKNTGINVKIVSRSAMETLAIIAYKGPITKAEIEQIRSVGVDKTMSNLLERKLIYISGRKKTAGTPNLYEVTDDFYSYLNIHGKQELPGNEQFQKIELLYKEDEKAENEDSKEGEKLNSEEDSEPKAKEEIEKIKE